MRRVEQPEGQRGSLKWIQIAIASHRYALDEPIRRSFPDVARIDWLSPLGEDNFAEYRDSAFLERLGLKHLADDLAQFWPRRGPQWDALARSGEIRLLVEAKAHLPEVFSPASKAKSAESQARIRTSMERVAQAINANPIAPWDRAFYQYANRIAHLHFLRETCGVDARLVFVDFIGDSEMEGPQFAAEWDAAYRVIDHVLGLDRNHALSKYIAHIHPDTRTFSSDR